MDSTRIVRKASRETSLDRARALAVERALATCMIAAIVGISVVLLHGGAPRTAVAESERSTTIANVPASTNGRYARHRREEIHTDGQSLRDAERESGR